MFSLPRYLRHQLGLIFRKLMRSRPLTTPLESPALTTPLECQTQSPLLGLNVDVVILIMSFLPHPDQLSAALSCKSLHFICDQILHGLTAPLSIDDRGDFLLRLEQDLMATHIYCAICTKLHKYSSLTKPTESPEELWISTNMRLPICLGFEYRYSPISASNHFAYHYGRAAMNHHFYGPLAGVSPGSLRYETTHLSLDKHWNGIKWSTRYSIRIICDSLFLYGEHTMNSPDISSMMTNLDEGMYDICHHITTEEKNYETLLTRAAGLDASEVSRSLQQPGRQVHGSCALCLTDYTVEITRKRRLPEAGMYYQVRLQTYHDFGQFRSPEEWKWRAWRLRYVLTEPWYGEPRDAQLYPPGSVRLQYYAAKDGEDGSRRSLDHSS